MSPLLAKMFTYSSILFPTSKYHAAALAIVLLFAMGWLGSWCDRGKKNSYFLRFYSPTLLCHGSQWFYSDLHQLFGFRPKTLYTQDCMSRLGGGHKISVAPLLPVSILPQHTSIPAPILFTPILPVHSPLLKPLIPSSSGWEPHCCVCGLFSSAFLSTNWEGRIRVQSIEGAYRIWMLLPQVALTWSW